jgi:hypothetical protein
LSKPNYDYILETDLTGPHTPTCFVAAIEILLDGYDIPPWIYHYYTQAYNHQAVHGQNRRFTKKIINTVLSVIHKDIDDLSFFYVGSVEKAHKIFNGALNSGKIILAFPHPGHIVGLKSIDTDVWQMVGTWVPTNHYLTTAQVVELLYKPTDRYKNKRVANIWLIPISKTA